MKNLSRYILFFALALGTATASEAGPICCLINKIVECPPIRKLRNECRAKKEAKKMKAKKKPLSCLKKLCEKLHGGNCDCDGCSDGDCESDCGCERDCD
jgi:hypothetical protein